MMTGGTPVSRPSVSSARARAGTRRTARMARLRMLAMAAHYHTAPGIFPHFLVPFVPLCGYPSGMNLWRFLWLAMPFALSCFAGSNDGRIEVVGPDPIDFGKYPARERKVARY